MMIYGEFHESGKRVKPLVPQDEKSKLV
ncbi:unknown protein [Simkania negevensis Z]|uniref:Uncharacterized protein n=1 Tax=Simkania negevensis (strain ATCC VR-1471 / DSM 27360 / Z) TaxID=331113 RepID=F8L8I8_SIMNZ|nr:unknown protein [Simkania negevensis Z]